MIYKDRYIDSLLNKIVGDTLKKERERKSMTLEQLAAKVNRVSRQTLSTYETGRSKIRVDMFIDICKALGLDPKEEFDRFISVIDDSMYHLLFTTLFYTGIRKGELLCLTWNDIDLKKKVLYINKTLYKIHNNTPTSNKTHKNRQIYLNDSLVANLTRFKAQKKVYKDFSDNWYVFGDVFTLATTTLERKKHHYFNLSGVREITIHEFRHSHVSMLVNEYIKNGGTDGRSFLISVSARLGHSIPVMFKTYLHLFPNTQNDIVKMLNNM